jgi:hypothetical protein
MEHYSAEIREQPGRQREDGKHDGNGPDGNGVEGGGGEDDARLLFDRSKDAQVEQRRYEQSRRDVAAAAAAQDPALGLDGSVTPGAVTPARFDDVHERTNPFEQQER